jgi:hypothetical protein
VCTLYVYHYKPRFLETDKFLCKSSHTYPSFAFSDFQRPWILKSLSVIPNLHAAERQLCNQNILLFTPSVAKADFTISLALVYDSFSLEMPVPSQGHYGVHSFPLLTDFVCLYTYAF